MSFNIIINILGHVAVDRKVRPRVARIRFAISTDIVGLAGRQYEVQRIFSRGRTDQQNFF